jgi:nucleoside-diphosphate-sugar epimerase
MAHYLVTGAAGFIGARLVEMLIEQGHTVTGVDNLNEAYDVRMKEYRLRRLQALSGFTFHKLDIADRSLLNPQSPIFNQEFEAVINLAARAGVRESVEDPWAFMETNLTGTLNLLELCRQRKIIKFVQASTAGVYGANSPLPTPEDAETDRPLQPYAASKKSAEVLCHTYHFLHGLDITVFRYFTVYGPAGRPDMVMFRFAKWIREGEPVRLYGSGEQSRGFTFLDDIVRGTLLGLKPVGFEIINLGGHETLTINNMIRILEEMTGRQARIERLPAHPADILSNWANIEKAGHLLGWEPQISLKEGIQRLVDWYESERSWAKEVATP